MASTISAGTTTTTALVYTADTSGVLQLQTNGTTAALTINTSQQVGIGTASPSNLLSLAGTTNTSAVLLGLSGTGTGANLQSIANTGGRLAFGMESSAGGYIITGTSAYDISFSANATNMNWSTNNGSSIMMKLDTSGNLGIGGSPSAQLHVIQNSDSYFTSGVRFTRNGTAGQYGTISYSGGAYDFVATDTTLGSPNFRWRLSTDGSTTTNPMTLDNSGNLVIGGTTAATARFNILTTGGSSSQYINCDGDIIGYAASNGGASATQTVLLVQKVSNGRSINCAGTVNQNGADYAEYMTKSGNFTINKGDICGIDANGKLTNVFANAISFVVKSTNPGLVGGDAWGSEEALGLTAPQEPTRSSGESDADWQTAQANYQTALSAYKTELATALESARQMVDRIAFCGQVPVNVTGATAGQYIVPIAKQDGSIGGEAVSESAITLQQYMQSVGKVISVANNVTTIIVKVA